MKLFHAVFFGILFIGLVAVDSSADSEVEGNSKPKLDPKIAVASVNETNLSKKVDQVKDEKVVVGTSKEEGVVHGDENTKPVKQKEPKPKEVTEVSADDGSREKPKEKTKNDGKKDESSGNETNEVSNKGKKNEGNEKTSIPLEKEGPRVKECDTPYKCTTKDTKLLACLMFPGNESPELYLLIQNKGDSPLTIEISAPNYVKLGEKSVQLKEKDRKEVKVSIPESRPETSITLIGIKENCSIDLRDLFENTSVGSNKSSRSINFLRQTPVVAVIAAFCGVILIGSAWLCIIKERRKVSSLSGEVKYERVDMELPVTDDRKTTSVTTEAEEVVVGGWDDGWGDSWDDEEAPLTPSKPLTPSISGKGLATRRTAKEGWKD